jgi:hypothetical protein
VEQFVSTWNAPYHFDTPFTWIIAMVLPAPQRITAIFFCNRLTM